MTHPSILVIEDDSLIREAIVMALIRTGHDAVPAEDGRAALLFLEAMRSAGVFLVDLLMPGEDGWHVVEQIRSHGIKYSLCHKIIIISGLHNAQTIAHLESVGFLSKPFTINQLLAVVDVPAQSEAA